jgi:hypothetical protein
MTVQSGYKVIVSPVSILPSHLLARAYATPRRIRKTLILASSLTNIGYVGALCNRPLTSKNVLNPVRRIIKAKHESLHIRDL